MYWTSGQRRTWCYRSRRCGEISEGESAAEWYFSFETCVILFRVSCHLFSARVRELETALVDEQERARAPPMNLQLEMAALQSVNSSPRDKGSRNNVAVKTGILYRDNFIPSVSIFLKCFLICCICIIHGAIFSYWCFHWLPSWRCSYLCFYLRIGVSSVPGFEHHVVLDCMLSARCPVFSRLFIPTIIYFIGFCIPYIPSGVSRVIFL